MSAKSVTPIRRLLVANRGEIAIRIMRACKEMGITTIAVYGDGEESAPHVRYADESYRLRAGTGILYLDIPGTMAVAKEAAADAVHPGYGFLAENAAFARAVLDAGLTFVGPSPEAIAAMGDKVEARRIAAAAGVPSVAGTMDPVPSVDAARVAAADIGYPIAVKAAGGGGGRGFRVARDESELDAAFAGSRGEAERYFANPEVYLERYLERPRHIEVQVFADTHGNVAALGERDCSIQRRHQKLVEEAPSPAVDEDLRRRLCDASVALARAVDYVGAGTVEYLLDANGEFSFLEMNTRIQVEHTVTEMITGIDLVREQLLVAMGHPLSFATESVERRGAAIEFRINAEDAGRGFAPSPGTITRYREPAGFGVRVDGALGASDQVLPIYDSLIAKLVVWGRSRQECIERSRRALSDFDIGGVPTTIPFHLRVLDHPSFVAGDAATTFLEEFPEVLPPPHPSEEPQLDEALASPPIELLVEVNGRRFETVVRGAGGVIAPNGQGRRVRPASAHRRSGSPALAGGDALVSPIQGTVIRVDVADGDVVEQGQVVCVVEAMKMENELVAHKPGTVADLTVSVGATLAIGQAVASIVNEV